MNSQEQLKEEPVEEYHSKKRTNKRKTDSLMFYTIIFLNLMIILFFIITDIKPILWLSAFFFFTIWYMIVSFLSLYKLSFRFFFGSFLFAFCIAALFWFLSYKNYNVGYNETKMKNEFELVTLTKNILGSNLPSEQQQEYLKILFSQYNAKIRVYSKERKELKEKNIIYQQDFQIKKGVTNYRLDTDFKMNIPLNDDSKIYIMDYTSYKEKEKINPFVSAILFNMLKIEDKNLLFWYTNGMHKIIINSLCFYVPFIVLWCFLLIYLKKEKSTNNSIDPEFRKEIETIMKEHKDEFDKLK